MQSQRFSLIYLLPFVDEQHRLPPVVSFDAVLDILTFLMGRLVHVHEVPKILQGLRLKARPAWLVLLEREVDTILNVLEPGNYMKACRLIIEEHDQVFDIYPLTADQVRSIERHEYVAPPVRKRTRWFVKRFLAWLGLID